MGKKSKAESTVTTKIVPSIPDKEDACGLLTPGTLSPIAQPLADAKLYKKILKTVTKGISIFQF